MKFAQAAPDPHNGPMWAAVRWCIFSLLASCLPLEALPLPATLPSTLAASAQKMVGSTALDPFRMSGTGFVRALLAQQGIDAFDVPAARDPRRTGIELLYQFAALNGRFHTSRTPLPGDLVFFGRTRDLDRDGKPDPLSHVGVVLRVDPTGTAHIAMGTMTRVVSIPMNLTAPAEGLPFNGRLVSSITQPRLVSELFYTFARLGP